VTANADRWLDMVTAAARQAPPARRDDRVGDAILRHSTRTPAASRAGAAGAAGAGTARGGRRMVPAPRLIVDPIREGPACAPK
jgi:hypothetical protein